MKGLKQVDACPLRDLRTAGQDRGRIVIQTREHANECSKLRAFPTGHDGPVGRIGRPHQVNQSVAVRRPVYRADGRLRRRIPGALSRLAGDEYVGITVGRRIKCVPHGPVDDFQCIRVHPGHENIIV